MSGWTGLFRKSPKLKPDGTLRWFGKLPTYRDYYRSPLDDAWAAEFNDWISKGYEIYYSRMASPSSVVSLATGGQEDVRVSPVRRLPMSGCILRLPKSGMTVLASIHDYGGDAAGRPFPICFYVGLPTAQWPGPTSDGLAGAARVLRQLMGLRRDVIRFCNTPGRFESSFGSRELELDGINGDAHDDGWLRQAAAISMTDWLAAVRRDGSLPVGPESPVHSRGATAAGEAPVPPGDAGPALQQWSARAARWGDNISRLESDTFNPTFSFPLAAGLGWEVQTAGWIRWLESRMDLKRRSLSLIVVDEPDEAPARLIVVAREPVADDFLLLTPLYTTLPYLDDLSAARDGDPLADGQPAPAQASLCASWRDFAAMPGTGAKA